VDVFVCYRRRGGEPEAFKHHGLEMSMVVLTLELLTVLHLGQILYSKCE